MPKTFRDGSFGTLYYDSECRLCVGFVWRLRLLDGAAAVRYEAFQELETPPLGLTWRDLESAAFLVSNTGKTYKGFWALRMLALKIPALRPLIPLLWLPGAGFLGSALYRWIASHRYRLSGCCEPGPKIPPNRRVGLYSGHCTSTSKV